MKRTGFAKAECPVARALDAIGDWWSLLIVRDAFDGLRRFGEFQKNLGIAKGMLTTRMKTDDSTLKGFTDQIAKLNERMDAEQKRLKAQFAAMETALNNSQTQQAWLTSQIASLPSL